MTNTRSVQLVECSRDAMQGWHTQIPTELKINYLNALLQVGFHTIDCGSFVSHKAIPQMSDTKEVLEGITMPSTSSTKLLAIVANIRGAETAAQHSKIAILGFPFSISPTFQLRNTNSSILDSLDVLKNIQTIAEFNKKQLVVYLSMGFGNPYGDHYSIDVLLDWADQMVALGIDTISLADTVGLATPGQISLALNTLIPKYPTTIFGVHLHATSQNWLKKMDAAIQAGCFRFDGAINGIGGCPMAQDKLVGNMDTISMIAHLKRLELAPSIHELALADARTIADQIFSA